MPLISVSCGLRLLFMQSPDSHICLRHLFGRLTNPLLAGSSLPAALCQDDLAGAQQREGGGTSVGGTRAPAPRGEEAFRHGVGVGCFR